MQEDIDDWEHEDLMKPSRTLQYDSLNFSQLIAEGHCVYAELKDLRIVGILKL